jgi:hypothetical protein
MITPSVDNKEHVMDVSKLTIEQLIECLRITGYNVAPNEFKLTRTTSDTALIYVPHPTSPRYLAIADDIEATDDEPRYMIIALHLRFVEGKIGAEYGAMPLAEGLSKEEAFAFINGALSVILDLA